MTAIRYLIGYDGSRLSVIHRRVVQATAPAGTSTGDLAGRSGFWCEVRGPLGAVLYRQVLRDPRRATTEVHGSGSARVAGPSSGAVSVVVPDLAGAQQVCLVSRRLSDPAPHDVLAVDVTRSAREVR